MKPSFLVGWLLGIVVFAMLVVLWVSGNGGAGAIVLTAAGIVVMIALGNVVGGRRTPTRAPLRRGEEGVEHAPASGAAPAQAAGPVEGPGDEQVRSSPDADDEAPASSP